MFKAHEGLFFPAESSDRDASTPGPFELNDVLLGCFWPFVDVQGFFLAFYHLQTFLCLQH